MIYPDRVAQILFSRYGGLIHFHSVNNFVPIEQCLISPIQLTKELRSLEIMNRREGKVKLVLLQSINLSSTQTKITSSAEHFMRPVANRHLNNSIQ